VQSVELSINCSFVVLIKEFVLQTGAVKNTTLSTYKQILFEIMTTVRSV
jgi:hypothetical protein